MKNYLLEMKMAVILSCERDDALKILGKNVISPKYLFDGKEIWGATAIILYQLFLRRDTKINLD